MKSLLVRFLVYIVFPLIVGGAYVFHKSNVGLPLVDGVFEGINVRDKVIIDRDENGVVFIEASNDNDVFFGLGVAHAQDRLWQLEIQRRTAQGRLSEIFGYSSIAIDANMRTLGFYKSAESAWSALSPRAKESLSSYAAGINSVLLKNKPVEFYTFGIEPEPWTEIDSLAWSKVFSLSLSGNMWNEILRFLVSSYLSAEQFATFFPSTSKPPESLTSVITNTDDLLEFSQVKSKLEQDVKIGGKFVGSNAWVVSGKHTVNGNAILANDPHLGIQMPSLWYVASLKGGAISTSGMTLVGLPIVVFGKNDKISWGGTNMMADVQDLYFEQVNSENRNQYRDGDIWRDFEIEHHQIKVKRDFPEFLNQAIKPIEVVVRRTVRGPVINDILGVAEQPISLKWTSLEKADTSYQALYDINYAYDWKSFTKALENYVAPALNYLYADIDANIGYIGAGKIPIRTKGTGDFPTLSHSSASKWIGYIPFSDLPQEYNPDRGFIVSANNKVRTTNKDYHISSDWAPPTRAIRIKQLLEDKIKKNEKISVMYTMKMQSDNFSLDSLQLVKVLRNVSMENERQMEAKRYLDDWDGEFSKDSVSASIFYHWARNLKSRLFSKVLKVPFRYDRNETLIMDAYSDVSYDAIAAILTKGEELWCSHERGKARLKSCSEVMQDTLDSTVKDLTKILGADISEWKWGNLKSTVYSHTPFSKVNLLDKVFERRVSTGGGPNTINVSGVKFVKAKGYEQSFGAGFRQVIVPADEKGKHFYMNSTGQSGRAFSPHYDDMLVPFSNFKYANFNDNKIVSSLVIQKSE